jgi:DDE superfamily endonuclease
MQVDRARRQTPCLRHRYRHDRLSVCSGLAVSPRRRRLGLYLRCQARSLTGLDIRAFLQHLLRHLRGPVDLLWDRGSIHRRREVRTFLADHPRLHVHYFPAYAPELNPAEYVWTRADHELANGVRTISANSALGWPARRADCVVSEALLWSCIYASDLPWAR